MESFSNFHKWWSKNHIYGWEIDKDLLIPGNKCYSEESCIYIPKNLNEFTTSRSALRGELPIGVTRDNRNSGLFRARISIDGNQAFLGRFKSKEEAHKAWYKKKIELAFGYKDLCDSIHPKLFDGLIKKVESLKEF